MHSVLTRVLIVDDDPEVLLSLEQALGHRGDDVRVAPSVPVGRRFLQAQDVDVVITDLLMEDSDGLDCIRELHHSWPRVRILAVSGGGRMPAAPLLTAAGRLGAQTAFQKPVPFEVLEATLRRLTLAVPRDAPAPRGGRAT